MCKLPRIFFCQGNTRFTNWRIALAHQLHHPSTTEPNNMAENSNTSRRNERCQSWVQPPTSAETSAVAGFSVTPSKRSSRFRFMRPTGRINRFQHDINGTDWSQRASKLTVAKRATRGDKSCPVVQSCPELSCEFLDAVSAVGEKRLGAVVFVQVSAVSDGELLKEPEAFEPGRTIPMKAAANQRYVHVDSQTSS